MYVEIYNSRYVEIIVNRDDDERYLCRIIATNLFIMFEVYKIEQDDAEFWKGEEAEKYYRCIGIVRLNPDSEMFKDEWSEEEINNLIDAMNEKEYDF